MSASTDRTDRAVRALSISIGSAQLDLDDATGLSLLRDADMLRNALLAERDNTSRTIHQLRASLTAVRVKLPTKVELAAIDACVDGIESEAEEPGSYWQQFRQQPRNARRGVQRLQGRPS